jgi:hypothetical protein
MKSHIFYTIIPFIIIFIDGCHTSINYSKNINNDPLALNNHFVHNHYLPIDSTKKEGNYSDISCDSLLTLLIKSSNIDSTSKTQVANPIAFTRGILKIQIGNTNELGNWVTLDWLELDTTSSELRNVTFGPDSVILLSYDTAIYRAILKRCFKH